MTPWEYPKLLKWCVSLLPLQSPSIFNEEKSYVGYYTLGQIQDGLPKKGHEHNIIVLVVCEGDGGTRFQVNLEDILHIGDMELLQADVKVLPTNL